MSGWVTGVACCRMNEAVRGGMFQEWHVSGWMKLSGVACGRIDEAVRSDLCWDG